MVEPPGRYRSLHGSRGEGAAEPAT